MLKNILSLLLSKFYSKKESELVGHQAMPSSQSISITPTVNSVGDEVATVATFNAQADGFVIVRATTDGAPASRLILSSYVSTYIFNNSAGGTIATFIPIAKGIQCMVQGRNLKNIDISLYKIIGGGSKLVKNALLQGGGLCLKHLYSSLRRSSLSVKRSGRQSNQRFLRAIQSCSLLLPTEKTITSQCPAQGTPTCAVMVFGLPTLTGAPSLTSGLMRTGISASISTPKRVNSLDMLWGLVPNSLRLISIFTRPKAVSNLVVGGASC